MKNKFNLQLFSEDPASPTVDPAGPDKPAEQPKEESPAKYTDEDVDRLIGQKFAEWQKKQEKKVSEAERLGKMTAEEKNNERMQALEDKLKDYEAQAARSEMTKQARAILQDKNLHVSDELLSNLIAEDAENTKAAVESFISVFNDAVEKAVKERLKGETPKAGATSSGMTREQILAIPNTRERQKAISENMDLFK